MFRVGTYNYVIVDAIFFLISQITIICSLFKLWKAVISICNCKIVQMKMLKVIVVRV